MSRNVFDTYNAAYVQAVYEQYLQNPSSVDETWRHLFARSTDGLIGGNGATTTAAASPDTDAPPSLLQLRAARAAGELVDAYRLHGHRAARLDPLGSTPPGHPMLEPAFHGITVEDLSTVPAALIDDLPGDTMTEVLGWLKETYTGPIGYEFEHLEDPKQREWLREQIDSGAHRQPLSGEEKQRLLGRLTEVEALEQFVHRAYLGAKRFSIEGTDMMVPMLDLAIERAAAAGAREIAIGMAHRGRLNVLAHVLGMPYSELIAKFEGIHAQTAGTGDVKYHLGAEGTYATRTGEPLTVMLAPNPSHLEFVHAVIEGVTRAKQTDRTTATLTQDENLVVPIIIHGDAAFSGQGVVTETLNLSRLRGYRTGGTLHIIANNQVGFTTNPSEARSTDYASDVARGFDIPVFHVNGDDPEACLAVVRLAMMFRERFHDDVVIDLIGYRRYGHNESDEPAYTQPKLYRKIGDHPTVRRIWGERLAQEGVTGEGELDDVWQRAYDRLVTEQAQVKNGGEEMHEEHHEPEEENAAGLQLDTHVDAELLADIDRQLHTWPDGFKVNPKLARQLEKRSKVMSDGGKLDWAHAETLAFATLLTEGVPVRLTGQDTERGTFSQRHLVLHDAETDERYTPVASIEQATAPFEVHNSPLSELAAVGFEYGYSLDTPDALVVWEAQYGDFINTAQAIIDEFIVSGRAKWGQTPALVLLLPHGYEGQGPDHSTGRLERFLNLGAEINLRVAYPGSAAQYFHLLRRQAMLLETDPLPLVVMTPKSLLRHPMSASSLKALSEGSWTRIIDDVNVQKESVRRLILCSGKVYVDLVSSELREQRPEIAIARLEQLYPFPYEDVKPVLDSYPALQEVLWVQEEPQNMGAWGAVQPRLTTMIEDRWPLRYVGRPRRASPAEGSKTAHIKNQSMIVEYAYNWDFVAEAPIPQQEKE